MITVYAWILWVVLITSLRNGSVTGAATYLTSTGAGALGFAFARWRPSLLAMPEFAGGLLGVSGYVLLSTLLRGGAGGGPLGYANANAALAMQLLVISVLCLLATTDPSPRAMAGAAGAFSVAAIAVTSSRAGLATTVLVLVSLAGLWWAPRPPLWVLRLWALVWTTLVGLGLGAILVLTVRYLRGRAPAIFDEARYTLWSDALALWSQNWVLGGGPGAFVEFSDLAKDPDTARVHMSVLQVGAELGVVGVVLLLALLLALLVMLTSIRTRSSLVVLGGFAGLLVHSFVDYVLDFPVIILVAGLALGWATVSQDSEQFDIAERERPG